MLSAVIIAAVSAACSDSLVPETESLTAAPRSTISDGAHDGTPGFHLLPPLVAQPSVSGAPDGTLAPAIEVCDLGSSVPTFSSPCVLTGVATFTTTGGTGGESIRYDAGAGHYSVNWHTDVSTLQAGHYYRVRISVLGTALGFADVIPVSGSELRNHRSGEVIALVNGRTLPIKFRVQQGTVDAISSANGGTASLQDGAVTVVFPEGAVSTDIAVVATPVTPVPGVTDASVLSGTLYEFQPSPTEFAKPVTLTLTYPATLPTNIRASRLAICKMVDGACRPIAGSRVDQVSRTVTAEITSFSDYGVTDWPELLRRSADEAGLQNWALSTASGEVRWPSLPEYGSLDWSPSGDEVVMIQDSTNFPLNLQRVESSIQIRSSDGTLLRTLLRTPSGVAAFGNTDWSPVGDEIAFFHHASNGGPVTLMVINASGGEPRALAEADGNQTFGPAWSPDGQLVAFTCGSGGGPGVCSINRDGTGLRVIVSGFMLSTSMFGDEATFLSWSPDATRLAFSGQKWMGENEAGVEGLWVVNADGSNLRLLGEDRYSQEIRPLGASWSPTGEDILYLDANYSLGNLRAYIIRSDGTNRRPLLPFVENSPLHARPTWSRDGRRIAVPVEGGQAPLGVYLMNSDLTGVHLFDDRGMGWTHWRP